MFPGAESRRAWNIVCHHKHVELNSWTSCHHGGIKLAFVPGSEVQLAWCIAKHPTGAKRPKIDEFELFLRVRKQYVCNSHLVRKRSNGRQVVTGHYSLVFRQASLFEQELNKMMR